VKPVADQCNCPSCERTRSMQRPGYVCNCCGGTGRVASVTGSSRPCSRCNADEFGAWYAGHRALEGADNGQ